MLVLTRKVSESIVVELNGRQILIKCLSCDSGRIRIGIEADKDVRIVREEIRDKPPRKTTA